MQFRKFIYLAILAGFSCTDSGHANINGRAMHHADSIPNATVHIKYNAGFPGTDAADYDKSVQCDALGYFEFDDVPKGTHYLYARGWDSGITDSVFGGIPVLIDKKKLNKEVDVPVTE